MEEKILLLAQLYARQEPIYQEMLTVTRDLRDLCVENSFEAEGDREKLARLLLRRGELMEQAAAKQKEAAALEESLREALALGPVKVNAAALAERYSSPAVEHFSGVLRRLELLIKEIVALDTVTRQALRRSLQDTAREMGRIQTGKKASRAYHAQGFQPEGFFVDFSK
ncbi:MAG: hypothetical protein ACOX1X_02145 [Dethiobacteria bacterium]|jgi:hypothetical protein